MKIALTGAHGVGKSTLAKSLKEELEKRGIQAEVTPEVPRLICEVVNDKEYFRRGNNSLLKQSLILLGQFVVEERLQNLNLGVQICDRTLFDHWAYSLSLFSNEIENGNYTDIYERFISEHCKSYEKIFYIPIEFKPLDDGVRESDEDFQTEIDSLIMGLLKKHSISFEIITGSVEERTNSIIAALNL